ncbi:hypothetical protein [Diaminobutyricibacter sp. McL0608]|uniref:hypothetical protein n=1 Tax=Leifsonia sp. McL0608 TaxID=3143537 RepID=UPI0031F33587
MNDVRSLRSPLTADMLRPPGASTSVQFDAALSADDYGRLNSWFAQYPEVRLRVYGFWTTDLGFLEHLTSVRNLGLGLWLLESYDGIQALPPEMVSLGLGDTKKRLSVAGLERFRNLRELWVSKNTKDIDVVSTLTSLEDLTLMSMKLPDLSIVSNLVNLREFELALGGTQNLTGLETLPKLSKLYIWRVRGLTDLSIVSELKHLERLTISNLPHVAAIPDLSRLDQLEDVAFAALPLVTAIPDLSRPPHLKSFHLGDMRGIKDLRPLLSAPELETVSLIEMQHLKPEDVGILAANPTLRYVRAGLGSTRKNEEARRRVGLPEPPRPTT